MAYHVTKNVRGRLYRYQVESYRDAEGRQRSRWTYLGRVEGEETRPPARRSAQRTRERLLEALTRLLERSDYGSISAGAIAAEAGLAHGTFYRYFSDKRQALEAAVGRIAEAGEQARSMLEAPIGSAARERERLSNFVAAALSAPVAHPGLVRTWLVLTTQSADLMRVRMERRSATHRALASYLRRLREARLTDIDTDAAAAGILAAMGGAIQSAMLAGGSVSDELQRGVVTLVERAVFPQG